MENNNTPLPNTAPTETQTGSNTTRPPRTWLVESILVTLFCCLPFGIVGIINAAKVESRFYAGDIEAANRASAEAKRWSLIGLIVGVIVITLYIGFIVVAALLDIDAL